MLSDFETRLANLLGSELPVPFAGRVRRRGTQDPSGNGPVVRLDVTGVTPMEPDFGSVRPEVVPGSNDRRRVLRLSATVGIEVEPQGNDRLQQMAGIESILYEMERPAMRTGAALVEPGDQGFLLDNLVVQPSTFGEAPEIDLAAQGWFWPVGEAGEAGEAIRTALLREFRLPVSLDVAGSLSAGGSAVDLALRFGTTATMGISADSASTAPFGAVALRVRDAGGATRAGAIVGGRPGPEGTHLIDVGPDGITASYSPPSDPGTEVLSLLAYGSDEDNNEHLGVEIVTFDLDVVP